MKYMYIHAYLAGNLGDDLFVRILCTRYPHVHFVILADKFYKQTFQDISNLKVYDWREPRVAFYYSFSRKEKGTEAFRQKLICNAEAVVHIGGSSFVQHNEDWSGFFASDRNLVTSSKRLFLVGANFGPYKDSEFYKSYYCLFKQYTGICLRDYVSYQLFQELENVKWAPDVVWNYPAERKEKQKRLLIAPICMDFRTDLFGISEYGMAYLKFHVRIVKSWIKRGYQISMISFCPSQQDGDMMQRILDNLTEDEKERTTCLAYTGDVFPVLQEFASCEGVLATRFHSIILGFLYGCKVLPVIYDQKSTATLDDLEYPIRIELKDLHELEEDKLWSEYNIIEPLSVEKLKKEADRQFCFLDSFIFQ